MPEVPGSVISLINWGDVVVNAVTENDVEAVNYVFSTHPEVFSSKHWRKEFRHLPDDVILASVANDKNHCSGIIQSLILDTSWKVSPKVYLLKKVAELGAKFTPDNVNLLVNGNFIRKHLPVELVTCDDLELYRLIFKNINLDKIRARPVEFNTKRGATWIEVIDSVSSNLISNMPSIGGKYSILVSSNLAFSLSNQKIFDLVVGRYDNLSRQDSGDPILDRFREVVSEHGKNIEMDLSGPYQELLNMYTVRQVHKE